MTMFYISFADDDGFRGATVVDAMDAVGAIAEATRRGLNPGGEAAIMEVPLEAESAPDLVAIKNRLADQAEMMAQGGKRHGDLTDDERSIVEQNVGHICVDCNVPTR